MSFTRRGFLQGLAILPAATSLFARSPAVSPEQQLTLPVPAESEGDKVPAECGYDLTEQEAEDDAESGLYQLCRMTRLESFIKSRGIYPAHLARESGYSRQHLLRIRMGQMEPTRRCIAAIVLACQRLSRKRVRASDLFDLGDGR